MAHAAQSGVHYGMSDVGDIQIRIDWILAEYGEGGARRDDNDSICV